MLYSIAPADAVGHPVVLRAGITGPAGQLIVQAKTGSVRIGERRHDLIGSDTAGLEVTTAAGVVHFPWCGEVHIAAGGGAAAVVELVIVGRIG